MSSGQERGKQVIGLADLDRFILTPQWTAKPKEMKSKERQMGWAPFVDFLQLTPDFQMLFVV